jgi:biotin operon repressor
MLNSPDEEDRPIPAHGAHADSALLDAAALDLAALGLTSDATATLRLLLDGKARSQAVIGRELGISRMAVSRTTRQLEEAGLVRNNGRKPSAISLTPVSVTVQALAEEVQVRSDDRVARLRALAGALAGLGSDAPRGRHWLVPQGLNEVLHEAAVGLGTACVDLTVPAGRLPSYVPPKPPRRLSACRVRHRTLLGRNARVPAVHLAGEVRRSTEKLPWLRIVDNVRVGTELCLRGVTRQAWTTDPVEVRALGRLFGVLWDESEVLTVDDQVFDDQAPVGRGSPTRLAPDRTLR